MGQEILRAQEKELLYAALGFSESGTVSLQKRFVPQAGLVWPVISNRNFLWVHLSLKIFTEICWVIQTSA